MAYQNNLKILLNIFELTDKEITIRICQMEGLKLAEDIEKRCKTLQPYLSRLKYGAARIRNAKDAMPTKISRKIGRVMGIDYRLLMPEPDYEVNVEHNKKAIRQVYLEKISNV